MKLASILIPAAILITVASCSKTSSSAKPKLSIESFNNPVQPGEALDLKLKFTTNGGELSTGTLMSIRNRLNQSPDPNKPGSDTLQNPIPSFPNNATGEFEYTLPYNGYLSITAHENDTLVFKLAAITTAGVSSDTITTPQIIIINP